MSTKTATKRDENGRFIKGTAGGPGAPKGNRFNLKVGLRCALGDLPEGAEYIGEFVGQLRSVLEDAVMAKKKKVDVKDSLLIVTACRNEQVAMLAQRWLKSEGENMEDNTRLAYAREVALASERRDKAVDKLGLDANQRSELEDMYGPLVAPEQDDQNDE